MRRRISGRVHTGLGNPAPAIFDNKWTNNREFNNDVEAFFADVLKSVKDFEEWGGFDFKIDFQPWGFTIAFGIEPAYMNDPYICYFLDSNKDNICIHKGKAHGYYGSDIVISDVYRYDEDGFTPEYMSIINKYYDKLISYLK